MSRLVISRLRSRMLVSSKFEIYVMHLATLRVCPLRGKCFQCGLEGHLSHNCTQRAGYRARDDVVTEARDPTAEVAASVSATSQKVDLHDNQLDELSQSQSIVAWVLARVPLLFCLVMRVLIVIVLLAMLSPVSRLFPHPFECL